jgi:hypothetical protein
MCLSGPIATPLTVDCPNGSERKPSFTEDFFWALPWEVCDRLNLLLPYAGRLCDVLPPRGYYIDALCSTLPPELPELDWWALVSSGTPLIGYGPAIEWFWKFWERERWNTYCQCSEGMGAGPCGTILHGFVSATARRNTGYALIATLTAPASWTQFKLTGYIDTHSNPIGCDLTVGWLDAGGNAIGYGINTWYVSPPQGGSHTRGFLPFGSPGTTPDVRSVGLWAVPRLGTSTQNNTFYTYPAKWFIEFTGSCTNVPVTPPPPVLVDDPDPLDGLDPPPLPASCSIDTVCSMLNQLLPLLQNTNKLATVLQRYGLPFGYSIGTAHSGLSGTGAVAVSGLVGVRITITSGIPPKQLEGAPAYLWDAGWMSIIGPTGMLEEKRITREIETWQPRGIQEATQIGYVFKDGVVGEITELYPEAY